MQEFCKNSKIMLLIYCCEYVHLCNLRDLFKYQYVNTDYNVKKKKKH